MLSPAEEVLPLEESCSYPPYSISCRRSGGVALLATSSCLPAPPVRDRRCQHHALWFLDHEGVAGEIDLSGFCAKWKEEHGQEVHFTSSFAGSETVTNQILQGVGADIAILSIERDAQRLKQGGFVTSDWHALPYKGIVNKTPFVILVRKGNPKGIHDFPDLAKPGIVVFILIRSAQAARSGRFWRFMDRS